MSLNTFFHWTKPFNYECRKMLISLANGMPNELIIWQYIVLFQHYLHVKKVHKRTLFSVISSTMTAQLHDFKYLIRTSTRHNIYQVATVMIATEHRSFNGICQVPLTRITSNTWFVWPQSSTQNASQSVQSFIARLTAVTNTYNTPTDRPTDRPTDWLSDRPSHRATDWPTNYAT